jgi:hypothetical protein
VTGDGNGEAATRVPALGGNRAFPDLHLA